MMSPGVSSPLPLAFGYSFGGGRKGGGGRWHGMFSVSPSSGRQAQAAGVSLPLFQPAIPGGGRGQEYPLNIIR